MKKKLFVLFLSLVMLFAFVACDNTQPEPDPEPAPEKPMPVGEQVATLDAFNKALADDSIGAIVLTSDIELTEPLTISRSVTIRASKDGSLSGTTTDANLIVIDAADVEFDDVDVSGHAAARLIQVKGNNFKFTDGSLTGTGDQNQGIVFENLQTTGGVISGSLITGCDRPIYVSVFGLSYTIDGVSFDGYIELEDMKDRSSVKNCTKSSDSATAGIYVFTNASGANETTAPTIVENLKSANPAIADNISCGLGANDPA